jgi:hypothetical protein
MNQAYMNVIREIRKIQRRIEYVRHARGSTNNNNERANLNKMFSKLLSKYHPLELRKYILELNIPANKQEQLRKRSHVVSSQMIAKKAMTKRRNATRALRRIAIRSFATGAHHTVPRMYLPTVASRRPSTIKKRVTRSVSRLTRYLSN